MTAGQWEMDTLAKKGVLRDMVSKLIKSNLLLFLAALVLTLMMAALFTTKAVEA